MPSSPFPPARTALAAALFLIGAPDLVPAPAAGDPSVPAVECRARAGLPNVLEKLRAGHEVRVAFLGGSITAQEGWRPQTLAWLRERFPAAKLSEVNAAIGGTGSDLGVFRLRRDVLDHHPDLLFVEFAVNDGGSPPEAIRRCMDGIVRQARKSDARLDICFVYTLAGGMLEELEAGRFPRAASVMEEVADRYGIPSIHLGVGVARLSKEGKLVFQGKEPSTDAEREALAGKVLFSPDGVHPYPATGHRLYLEAIARSFPAIEAAGAPPAGELPAPLVPDTWEAARMLPLDEAARSPGWRKLDPARDGIARSFAGRMGALWAAERPGEWIELRFRGTAAGVYDLLGPDCGQVAVSVDGGAPSVHPRFDSFSTYHRLGMVMAAVGLPEGEHRVRLELLADGLDKPAILATRGEKIDDPHRFEGRSWYAGAFLLVGEPLAAAPTAPPAPSAPPAPANTKLRIDLSLGRTAYCTDERIDLAVVRSADEPLPTGDLVLTVAGGEGSRASFTFPAPAVAIAGGKTRATVHLALDGRLLPPGSYALEAVADGTKASARFDLFSHVRRSTFRLIDWGSRAQGADLAKLGEEGLGFNLIFGDYRLDKSPGNAEATLRGGADYMQSCAMSGGHQMDLRQECDWSDPYVVRGATARAVQQAFIDRTKPNALGVHLYDEPGLTWWKDPRTGKFTPHGIPAQDRAYRSAFGQDPPPYFEVKPDDAAAVAAWTRWGRWKESFLEAAWRDARQGIEDVAPGLLSVTQSMYAFNAYTDGYYFNVVRSLPVASGHGGYDDGPASYFYPSFHLEFGRARDRERPAWYLPVWYGGMRPELFRLEQYLSFMTGVQGMAKPPDLTVHDPASTPTSEGIIESNRVMERLGTIFEVMPPPGAEVAVLYSLSQCLDAQVRSGMEDNYLGGGHTRAKLLQVYLASKMMHVPMAPVVEEDVLDGSLAAHHRAVVLAGIDALDPPVIAALEEFARNRLVILTADSKVEVKGAVRLEAPADLSQYELIESLWKTDQKASFRERRAERFLKAAEPLAGALAVCLNAAGIQPVVECDSPTVVASRHIGGEVEYFFLVNATPAEGEGLPIRTASAAVGLPGPGGSVYDAVRGGPPPEIDPATLRGTIRFGPGGMRVLARTARPIGGVQVSPPEVSIDLTRRPAPIRVSFTVFLLDSGGTVLAGAAPLQARLIDPAGAVRYDLLRAFRDGSCRIELPLAALDAPGGWKVVATELLSGKEGTARFNFSTPTACPAIAGAVPRAVMFGDDRAAIFRFFRRHSEVTVLHGSTPGAADAAKRLAEVVRPWGVLAKVAGAASMNRPREISQEEARTWVGLEFGKAEPGAKSSPYKTGFALEGPAVLIGSAADNPLIAAVEKWGFLPYRTGPDFPGRGRGFLAWQRDAVGIGLESVTVIGSDAEGLAEAVGSLYEAAAGMEPLTPLVLPHAPGLLPLAEGRRPTPEAAVAWTAVLPDRAVSLEALPRGGLSAVTLDGSRTTIEGAGKASAPEAVDAALVEAARASVWKPSKPEAPPALKERLLPARMVKRIVAEGDRVAVAYWGGGLQVFAGEALWSQQLLPGDVAAMLWQGDRLAVALSDGRVMALAP